MLMSSLRWVRGTTEVCGTSTTPPGWVRPALAVLTRERMCGLQDVVAPGRMRRKIHNPRILLMDCPLEYKKGENQTNVELTKEEDWCARPSYHTHTQRAPLPIPLPPTFCA